MKIIILFLFLSLCENVQTAAGQDNILFVYIGPLKGCHDSVLITTPNPYDGYFKCLEGPHTKVYYTDEISMDSLRSLITRSNFVSKSYPVKNEQNETDTLARLDVYKIIGVATYPLYIQGSNCFQFFSSGWGWLVKSVTSNAMLYLMFRCHVRAWLNDVEVVPAAQIRDPYNRLKDYTPLADSVAY